MTQLDSDLDLPAGEWRLYPDGRPSHEGFTQVDSDITHVGSPEGSAYIFAKIAVNDVPTDLIVDTGAPGQLYLGSSATKRLEPLFTNLASRDRREGPRLSRVVRADTVQVGDVLFQRPLVPLDDPDHATSSRLREGIIGLALLEHMILSTDVRARKLWVRRGNDTKPYEDYNISGLWLSEEKGRVIVADVGQGSPAKAAGVHIGDEVKGLEFRNAIRHINQPIGSLVQLMLERDGNPMEIKFHRTPYL